MAKVGLKNFLYGILNDDGTYGVAKKPARAISCKVDITNNDAKLYADDVLAESDTSFQGGTATLGIDDEDQVTMAELLGHTVDTNGVMVRSSNDTAPWVGFGRVVTKMVNGSYKYKVEFLHKVKFSEPSQEDNTKGENVEFATTELVGQIASLDNGDWSKTKTFDTMADAQDYLASLFTQPVVVKYTVTYDVNGGEGTIAPVEVTAGQSITLDDGSGITPPTDETFLGWAKTSSAQTATVTSPYTPDSDVTLYAVYGA